MKKPKQVQKTTTDNRVYKSARRYHIAGQDGRCPLCPPHGGENAKKKSKSWKDTTKSKHQFGGNRMGLNDIDLYGKQVAVTSTGFVLYENDQTRTITRYAKQKNVRVVCYLAVRNGEGGYALLRKKDQVLVYYNPVFEAVAVHIDILALDNQVYWDEDEE